MAVFNLVIVAIISYLCVASATDSSSDVDHLENLLVELNKDYKRFVPPQNVTVSFGINYLCAVLDERSQILTSRVFERYKWTDPRLTWDPSKFGGIELVHAKAKHVWLPDNMRALNSVEDFVQRDDITVAIDHDGHVYWFPLALYKTFCSRSSSYRSDHAHHCYIGFGPWSQGKESLPTKLLFRDGVEIDDTIFFDQCPYVIGKHHTEFTTEKYDCCPEPFQLLSFHFDLHKRGYGKGKKTEEKEEQAKGCAWPHC